MVISSNIRLTSNSYNANSSACTNCNTSCVDKFNCPNDKQPDFIIKRYDTKPAFKVLVEDCDGPLDVRGLVIEANMWTYGSLKSDLNDTQDYFALRKDIGFEQIMVGDILVFDRVRMPEKMLVIGFDENNKFVQVQRGYQGTTPSVWKRNQLFRIFRTLNSPAESEMIFEDIEDVDGSVEEDVLTESYVMYNWQPEDTCLPGCYYFEFKLIKMQGLVLFLPGGYWSGSVHTQSDGYFYTGSVTTDSSVQLSYDSVNDRYVLSNSVWNGNVHDISGTYFTGSVHDDGSVFLNRTGVVNSGENYYDENGLVSSLSLFCCGTSTESIIPSFTDSTLLPEDFCCGMTAGVEWVRRIPACEKGFLIKIENSPTAEC